MDFRSKLAAAWQRNDSPLCRAGPGHQAFSGLPRPAGRVLAFCKGIVNATADLACLLAQIAYLPPNWPKTSYRT